VSSIHIETNNVPRHEATSMAILGPRTYLLSKQFHTKPGIASSLQASRVSRVRERVSLREPYKSDP